jgi:hypothetical protein
LPSLLFFGEQMKVSEAIDQLEAILLRQGDLNLILTFEEEDGSLTDSFDTSFCLTHTSDWYGKRDLAVKLIEVPEMKEETDQ